MTPSLRILSILKLLTSKCLGLGIELKPPGNPEDHEGYSRKAERGYACITANTRMHDLGNVAGYRGGKRIRGGGYWGVASEEVRDLAAWIDFAEERGFKEVVLVGHSAGWAAVRSYQAEKQDPRVVGMVVASGMVWVQTEPPDPELLA